MRSKFEKLPNISLAIPCVRFDIRSNEYISTDSRLHGYALGIINGAWYAFQEQQRKIDAITNLCNNKRGDIHWQVDYFIEEIEELLK